MNTSRTLALGLCLGTLLAPHVAAADATAGRATASGTWSYNADTSWLDVNISDTTYQGCFGVSSFSGTVSSHLRSLTLTESGGTEINFTTLRHSGRNNPVAGVQLLREGNDWQLLIFKSDGSFSMVGQCSSDGSGGNDGTGGGNYTPGAPGVYEYRMTGQVVYASGSAYGFFAAGDPATLTFKYDTTAAGEIITGPIGDEGSYPAQGMELVIDANGGTWTGTSATSNAYTTNAISGFSDAFQQTSLLPPASSPTVNGYSADAFKVELADTSRNALSSTDLPAGMSLDMWTSAYGTIYFNNFSASVAIQFDDLEIVSSPE